MANSYFPIGELGRLTDTKVETIRYYERIGLLAADITDTTQESELADGELLEPESILNELMGELA